MRITRFFSAMLVILAFICTFVLFASAKDKTLPGVKPVCIYKKTPVERQKFTKMSSHRSVPSSGDQSSGEAPPTDHKAVMTQAFDSNISKKYSVVFNLRQYQPYFTKLLIKSRALPVDYVPLSRDSDNTWGNVPFFPLNFGNA